MWNPFLVYRFILYTGNFEGSPSNYVQNSFGVVYICPVSYKTNVLRTQSMLRTAAFTLRYVHSKDILTVILIDIVEGTLHGFDGINPYGNIAHVFLDCVRFLADFHEAADGIDVLSHNAKAGCNLFMLRKYTGTAANISFYGYAHRTHSANASSQRIVSCHQALNQTNMSADDRNFM